MPSVRVPEKGSRPVQPNKKLSKSLKRKRHEEDLESLEKRVQEFDPKSAHNFSDLPLTTQTAAGLDKAHFKTLTDIQRKALPLALKGRDVLGAAKTGSGKTLAFLVPVLEILFRRKWTALDGLGALIISPTRELATQIFEVLRKIGREHAFSAGLVIGGKKLQEEREALHRMNIVVCTPGRMLQHMDQTFGLNLENLQLLVLDEADRCLDMGFKTTVDAVIANLPKERQTMLFSATQTKNVSDLARLSLKEPEYVAVHESAVAPTPTGLEQFYMVVSLPEKLDTLFSFLRNHLAAKIVVFMSACKQVRFVYETFRQLHIGIPLLHLHGKQKQTARADITARFSAAGASCLFATDVAARGLDFPAVDWVVQIDAPEDADTYIHRVGRTARYEKTGRSLLLLCPSEESGITKRLEAKKIPITRVNAKASKQKSIRVNIQGLCFKDPELKYLGQKAFVSYAKSISVQKDRESFKLDELPLEEFAASLGLPGAPRLRGLKSTDQNRAKERKNQPRGLKALEDGGENSEDEGSDGEKKDKTKEKVRTKYDKMVERRNQNVLADHYTKLVQDGSDAEDEEDFFKVKRRVSLSPTPSDTPDEPSDPTHATTIEVGGKALTIDSKRRAKLLESKKGMAKLKPKGQRMVFDDDGEAHAVYELQDEEGFRKDGAAEDQRKKFLEEEAERVRIEDLDDREVAKEKRREKREKRKAREREADEGAAEENGDDGVEVQGLLPFELPPEWVDQDEEEKGTKRQRVDIEEEDETVEDRKDRKKAKKEKKERKEKRKEKRRKVIEAHEEPETLEDLEKLASGLLA